MKRSTSRKTGPSLADIETDPTGRFTRSNQVLGRGASKVVYKGFDQLQGIEVAWNQVKIVENLSTRELQRLESEVAVLKRLKHRNIMKFYDSWIDQENHNLNFITEYFHPGPLRRHRRAHKHLSRRVLKRWAWQILQGLVYLHGHHPPIIHRDLKCDNIFIHGTSGEVKIGDLGLAKLMEEGLSTCQSVLGTPEFMAPELYREKYNEKVDIYAFGMCLLELVTLEFPYKECKNKAQIFRQVTLGVYPGALAKVEDAETREFIELCINHYHERRPTARQLVKNPFFDDVRQERQMDPEATMRKADDSKTIAIEIEPQAGGKSKLAENGGQDANVNAASEESLKRQPSAPLPSLKTSTSTRMDHFERQQSTPLPLDRQFSVQQRGSEGTTLEFELCVMRSEGTGFRRFKFAFDVESDTVDAVARELEDEFRLTQTETDQFTSLLKEELGRIPPKERFVPVENDDDMHASYDRFGRPGGNYRREISDTAQEMSLDRGHSMKRGKNSRQPAHISRYHQDGSSKHGGPKNSRAREVYELEDVPVLDVSASGDSARSAANERGSVVLVRVNNAPQTGRFTQRQPTPHDMEKFREQKLKPTSDLPDGVDELQGHTGNDMSSGADYYGERGPSERRPSQVSKSPLRDRGPAPVGASQNRDHRPSPVRGSSVRNASARGMGVRGTGQVSDHRSPGVSPLKERGAQPGVMSPMRQRRPTSPLGVRESVQSLKAVHGGPDENVALAQARMSKSPSRGVYHEDIDIRGQDFPGQYQPRMTSRGRPPIPTYDRPLESARHQGMCAPFLPRFLGGSRRR